MITVSRNLRSTALCDTPHLHTENRVANVNSSHLNKELQKALLADHTLNNLWGKQPWVAAFQIWSQCCLHIRITWGINKHTDAQAPPVETLL